MFDTLRYSKKLEEAGFTKKQAEVSLFVLVEVMESNLSTKIDIYNVRGEIKDVQGEIKDLRVEMNDLRNEMDKRFLETNHQIENLNFKMDEKFSTLEFKLIIKLGTIVVIAQGAFAALAKYL